MAGLGVAGVVAAYGWRRHRQLNGFDQWPEPHGPLYDEWMSIPGDQDGALDYYPWLLRRFGDREPWRTWVRRERNL